MPPKHALASSPGDSASRQSEGALTSIRGRGISGPSRQVFELPKRVQVSVACWYCRKKKAKVRGAHQAICITGF
jgi:hypothetical protein